MTWMKKTTMKQITFKAMIVKHTLHDLFLGFYTVFDI